MSEIRVRNDTGEALDDVRVTLVNEPQRPMSLGPSEWGRSRYVLRLEAGRLVVDLEPEAT